MSMYVRTYVRMLGRYVGESVYQYMDGLIKVLLFNVDDLDAYKHTYIHTYIQNKKKQKKKIKQTKQT